MNIKIKNTALFRQHMNNPGELQKLGFKVNVTVRRLSENTGRALKLRYNQSSSRQRKMMDKDMSSYTCPVYILRNEHIHLCNLAESAGNTPTVLQNMRRKSYIYPFGGVVILQVTTPTGEVYGAESACHLSDMFNRHIAHSKAIGKIFSQMYADAFPEESQCKVVGSGKANGKRCLDRALREIKQEQASLSVTVKTK